MPTRPHTDNRRRTRSTARRALLAITAAIALSSCAGGSSTGGGVVVVAVDSPDSIAPSFTVSGTAVEEGILCSEGNATNTGIFDETRTDDLYELTAQSTFVCTDGSGRWTFETQMVVPLVEGTYDGGTGEGTWTVVAGTGEYASLEGSGDWTNGFDASRSFVDTWTGEFTK